MENNLAFDSPSFPTQEQAARRRAETEALGEAIAELAAQIHAATFRLLELVRDFDERGGWGDGFLSCAHWLSWRTGIGPVAAREKVRVAHALPKLPKVEQAFRAGKLSYSKVRAISRVATEKTEEIFLLVAENASASHLEQVVRKYRSVNAEEENEQACAQQERRYFRGAYDDRGMFRFEGRLPPEAGAMLQNAISIAEEQMWGRGDDGDKPSADDSAETRRMGASTSRSHTPRPTAGQRRADALLLVAQSALDHELRRGSSGDRTQIVVHVDAAALKDENEEGVCYVDSGPNLAPQIARRLSCDATVVPLLETNDGRALEIHAVGRKRRTIPPSTARALRARDHRCAFPGCTHERFLEAHHVQHWIDGGDSNLGNLELLCSIHHQKLHQGGYRLQRDAKSGELVFLHPSGTRIEDAPTLSPPPDLAELRSAHLHLGISAETVGVWDGDRVDYNLIIESLSQSDQAEDD